MKNKIKESNKNESVKVGVVAGVLASLCCIGPIIIIFFGLGSVSFALSVTQYKPYFLVLGIIFIGLAIILHLKRKSKTCNINCMSLEGIKKEKKFIISIIITMVVIYLLMIYVVTPWLFKILG